MVATECDGAVVLGRDGVHRLADDVVDGTDPLEGYSPHAVHHLRRTDGFATAPDILCNGRFDPVADEVPAFEELVGSHGGLGGTQAQPFVFAPPDLPFPADAIVGAEALHRVLKPWAEKTMPAADESVAETVPV
jgi:hypothetical protein